MNEDTRFILRRMDVLEARMIERLDKLEAFKNKVAGLAVIGGVLAGGLGSLVVEIIIKKYI